jgi:hypothetical protein
MQKVFALIGVMATGYLTIGLGKVLVSQWWPDVPAQASQAPANASDTDAVSEREAVMRGIMWVRATLPRKVDDRTTLVAVGLDGKTYWSRLVLDADASEVSDGAKAAIQRDVTADVCRRLRSASHGDAITVYHVEYVDRHRDPVQIVDVSRHNCL